MKTTTNTAKLFVTDYASYNEGNQFEHGHWVDLSDFSDADDFNEYLENHFEECGIEDPEPMFTDFEGFPDSFYSESMSSNDLEKLYDFLNLNDKDKNLIEMYVQATGCDFDDIDNTRKLFQGTADSVADFAERLGEVPKDFPSWICIDWNASWNCNLRYDYNTATDDEGTMYFFLNR
jgi:hypothetical protein